MRRIRRRRKNIAQNMKIILGILSLTLLIYASCSAVILHKAEEQTMREIEQISGLYTEELDNRFLRISRRLFSTVRETDPENSAFWNYAEKIRENSPDSSYAVRRLRENTLPYMWEYGGEYDFFIYFEDTEQFYSLSLSDSGDYRRDQEYVDRILRQIRKVRDTTYSVKKKWNIVYSADTAYMCKIAQNRGVYFGCCADVKDILEPFSGIVQEGRGYVRLVDHLGSTVCELTREGIVSGETGKKDSGYTIRQTLSQAPFYIQMSISDKEILSVTMGSLLLLLSVAAVFVLTGAGILIYLRKNLIAPVQRFVSKLDEYDKGGYVLELTESNLLELEQIDEKFHRMIRQIQKLKITLYEKELQKQKVETDYLNLQIRPHFYLNCLNFIYSMIGFAQYDAAMKMTRITAEYLRYIFQSNREKVPVTAEVRHCEDYLKIMLLRYPGSFEYYFEVHDEVKDAVIFPFLIQVFIENAAKHVLTLDRNILISVTVYPEDRENGKYVNIYISDTGDGFPENILDQLTEKQEIDEKEGHVGINNCVRRFRYYYGDEGEIYFSNSPIGGAVVDIHIPYINTEEGRQE